MLSVGRLIERYNCRVIWNKRGGFKLYNRLGKLVPTEVINFVPMLKTKESCIEQGIKVVALPASASLQDSNNAGEVEEQVEEVSDDEEEFSLNTVIPKTHHITHFPFHPGCSICRLAKLKRRQARRQVEERVAENFGSLIHCDHLISLARPGTSGETACLIVKDEFTAFAGSYPSVTKSAELAETALLNFCGDAKVVTIRSDNSKRVNSSCNWVESMVERYNP